MEETSTFMAATFMMKSRRQLLEQLHHDCRRTWPMFHTRCSTDGFFHFSICCSNCL